MVETRAAYPNLWRVANLSHVLFLGCHWFAAFYYLISRSACSFTNIHIKNTQKNQQTNIYTNTHRQEDFSTEWGYPSSEQEESLKHVTQKYLRSVFNKKVMKFIYVFYCYSCFHDLIIIAFNFLLLFLLFESLILLFLLIRF